MTKTDKILEWKKKNYIGNNIYFKPVSAADLQFVVDMRNQEKSKYFLNQIDDSTLESQERWYCSYELKNDDIYWVYCDKETDKRLGTIRLYNVEKSECEIGSSTADQNADNAYLFFMEAHSLVIQFAKEILNIQKIHADTRTDNKFVDMVLRKLGFEFKKVVDIRGADYNYYEMDM